MGECSLAGRSSSGSANLRQLNPTKVAQIKEQVYKRVEDKKNRREFEAVWSKCVKSLQKAMQAARQKC